jgi:hypothetical protein
MREQLNQIFFAGTREDHEHYWQGFREAHKAKYRDVLRYIYDEWLRQIPEAFLRYYMKHYFHLNELLTSRVEGK